MCVACPLEAQHAWKLAKAGPAPALRGPHPRRPSALCRKRAFDSFRRDPRSGLALVWRGEFDLTEPHGPQELEAVSCLPSSLREARCRVGMLMREARTGIS